MGITNLGAVSMSAGGVYNSETVYKKYKVVSANGGSYMYINPTPAANVSLTDTSHWQQIAEKGDTFNLKGEWDDEAEDAFFDVVEYYGSSYVYINPIPSTGNAPTNETYWRLLAQAGG
ncbi:MAG: hypothetical protein PHX74_11505, partial [Candidatus Sumerlaeales bacterium]|nr:hypothetical protein [Candidatus Sumerlaeales bacterium]